ncbi:MAG: hypothetical protein LBD67_09275 [Candidatus Accumulibacter sp.]|jgi:hypothetical protein|nr:hypothetical protein [Accumulibacter sp.]
MHRFTKSLFWPETAPFRGILAQRRSLAFFMRRRLAGVDSNMLPTRFPLAWLFAAFVLGGAGSTAYAARPMMTDDARIVDPKSAQLETWVNKYRSDVEYWALPAFNFTGNLELTLGGARTRGDTGIRTTDQTFQLKTLFNPLEPNKWAWGLVVGNTRHPAAPAGASVSDLYAYIPASFSFRDDRFVLHANLGWLREKTTRRNLATWGIGSEARLNERSWFIAETFGQEREKPLYQIGFRLWLIPDRVQIDTTYGNRFGGGSEERWFSIGLRLLSAPFLP